MPYDANGNYVIGSVGSGGVLQGQAYSGTPSAYMPALYNPDRSLEDSDRIDKLRALLEAQAANGNPAAQAQLAQGTAAANQGTAALGQSIPGQGLQSSMRGIAEGQARNTQVAAGQRNIIDAQAKTQASELLQQLNSSQMGHEFQDAQTQQGSAFANTQLADMMQREKGNRFWRIASSIGQGIPIVGGLFKGIDESMDPSGGGDGYAQEEGDAAFAAGSDGGLVSGRPVAGGDDPRNDTVRALLSPGEIVIPRTIAQAPNAPEKSASFVEALQSKYAGGRVGYAGGGNVVATSQGTAPPSLPWDSNEFAGSNHTLGQNVESGGKLDLARYDQERARSLGLNDSLNAWASGQGPSTVPQLMTNATDANLQGAMRAGASPQARGGGAQAILEAASGRGQQIAGGGATQRLSESMRARDRQAGILSGLRGQDIEAQRADLHAATQMQGLQAGMSLQDLANLDRAIGAGGQAVSALSTMGGDDEGGDYWGGGTVQRLFDGGAAAGVALPLEERPVFGAPPALPADVPVLPSPEPTVDYSKGYPVVTYTNPTGSPDWATTAPATTPDKGQRKLTFVADEAAPQKRAESPQAPAPAASTPPPAGVGRISTPRQDPAIQGRIDAGVDQQKTALGEQGRLAVETSEKQGAAIEAGMVEAAKVDAQQQKMAADYQVARASQQQKFDRLTQQYADTQIDPGRYWANRGGSEKVLAAIGLALGSFSPDGINRSVAIINNAIDRDIDAQKANLSKKGAAVQQQGQLLGIMRENFGDDASALSATRASKLLYAENQVKALLARAKGPEQQAQLQQMVGQLEQQRGVEQQKADMAFKAQASENAYRNAQIGLEQQKVDIEAGKAGAAGGGKQIPAAEAQKIGDLQSAETQIDQLYDEFKARTGKFSFLTKHIPGTDASKYGNVANIAAQTIGGALEGGKLSDEDKRYYKTLLPEADDTTATADNKRQQMKAFVRTKLGGQLKALGGAGYNVAGVQN